MTEQEIENRKSLLRKYILKMNEFGHLELLYKIPYDVLILQGLLMNEKDIKKNLQLIKTFYWPEFVKENTVSEAIASSYYTDLSDKSKEWNWIKVIYRYEECKCQIPKVPAKFNLQITDDELGEMAKHIGMLEEDLEDEYLDQLSIYGKKLLSYYFNLTGLSDDFNNFYYEYDESIWRSYKYLNSFIGNCNIFDYKEMSLLNYTNFINILFESINLSIPIRFFNTILMFLSIDKTKNVYLYTLYWNEFKICIEICQELKEQIAKFETR